MNPTYIQRPGELRSVFPDWDVIHHFEGKLASERHCRATAEIVARRIG